MKVLVTGGAGFIGSHVVDACLAEGHEVVVADDLSRGRRENVPSGVPLHLVDIRSDELDRVFAHERPDVVSHQAALASVRESFSAPMLYAEVNLVGSLNVIECSRRHDVKKVIYASTGGAGYGQPEVLPVPETYPMNPLDPYGASKHHVEHHLFIARQAHGQEYIVLRYPNVYGPRQDPHGEAGVVAIFAQQMLKKQQPVINGSGEQKRDFVHAADIARGTVLALDYMGSGTYNLGTGFATSINRVYEIMAGLVPGAPRARYGPAKVGEVFEIALDAERARLELNWEPTITLEDGLRETVEYFRGDGESETSASRAGHVA